MNLETIEKALRYIDVDRYAKRLRKVRWKPIAIAMASAFLLASAFTVWMTSLLLPKQTATPTAGVQPAAVSPSVAEAGSKPTLSKGATETILKRNIFNSSGELGDGAEADKKPRVADSSEAIKTTLPLKLHGVIFGGMPQNGLALLEDLDKRKVDSYTVGDTVAGRAKLLEVYPDRAIIDNEGQREYVELEKIALARSSRRAKKGIASAPSSGGGETGGFAPITSGAPPEAYKEEGFERKGGSIQISDSFKRDLLGPKMSKVLQDAKAEPNMVGGELKGFRLVRIREDSIYQKAGLQNNDVIEEINGVPLKDAAGAIRLLQSLRSEKEIEVRVNRNGTPMNMNISVH